ncbi:uncharacterized protein LY79DRAFT_564095 [Colletotrichum navitas]|uniref:Uncharacterized protein n=1 Tax=Colletotrichum navitas TaxID=681940 RepID=A0AAD8PRS6_9PEZI|nr:uncharacterized protein LY79DRAFT_564095 [Colletotrichum navitas]KAK1579559.1 hypothetical protein LY79DRAFT_564095 [Colletotrichum navitas]
MYCSPSAIDGVVATRHRRLLIEGNPQGPAVGRSNRTMGQIERPGSEGWNWVSRCGPFDPQVS